MPAPEMAGLRRLPLDPPCTTPVLRHFQNSAGRRITVAASESSNVKRDEDLEEVLGRWLKE